MESALGMLGEPQNVCVATFAGKLGQQSVVAIAAE